MVRGEFRVEGPLRRGKCDSGMRLVSQDVRTYIQQALQGAITATLIDGGW